MVPITLNNFSFDFIIFTSVFISLCFFLKKQDLNRQKSKKKTPDAYQNNTINVKIESTATVIAKTGIKIFSYRDLKNLIIIQFNLYLSYKL